ncbi:MAG: ureidoglycolate lyase [Spirochaetales bacterium]|nr:ureidoglycolate lyase [Spirochaetales bacterium]
MNIKIELMTFDNFKPYGCMLSYPSDEQPDITREDLDYWKRPMSLSGLDSDGEFSFMRVKRREIILRKLDRLPASAELYLSLDGCSSVYFVAAPSSGANAKPDTHRIKAFLYSGPGGVLINPEVWHCTPFPLAHDADFFLGLRSNVILKNAMKITVGENQFFSHKFEERIGVEL